MRTLTVGFSNENLFMNLSLQGNVGAGARRGGRGYVAV